jgi:RNA polymerase sigma-70 factor, ECF subfamily
MIDDGENSVLQQAVAGDRSAQEQLFLAYYERTLAFIAVRFPPALREMHTAEDILQQTYVQAFRNIGGRQFAAPERFWAWMRTIAQNCLLDELRRIKRKKRGAGHANAALGNDSESPLIEFLGLADEAAITPSRAVSRKETLQAVQVALAQLCEDYRTVLTLYVLEGLDLAEVAARMDRSPDAVRGLIYRAKKDLRASFERSSLYLSR